MSKIHLAKAALEALGNRPEPVLVEDKRIQAAMDSLKSHPEINRLLHILWVKDPYTYNHSHRVADFSQWIGKVLGLSSQERVELYLSGLLHDVGKITVPDHILKKPGPLTPDEFSIIRLHPEQSGHFVSQIEDLRYLEVPIRGHHERIDGKGYPDQLVGDEIHIFSRIILVADTFDAMTTNRVYRKQLDLGRTYDELQRCSGTQFDPEAAKAFVTAHQDYMQGNARSAA